MFWDECRDKISPKLTAVTCKYKYGGTNDTVHGEMIKRAMFPVGQSGSSISMCTGHRRNLETVPMDASWIHRSVLTPDLSCLMCSRAWSSCLPGIVDVAVAQATQMLIAESRFRNQACGSCARFAASFGCAKTCTCRSCMSCSTRHQLINTKQRCCKPWSSTDPEFLQEGISEGARWWISA